MAKISHSIFKLVIALSLLSAVSSLTTLSYAFNNTAEGSFIWPTYPLGVIAPNTTISFTINTFTSNLDLAEANVQLVQTNAFILVNDFACSGQFCSDSYFIPSDSLPNTNYYFRIYGKNQISMLLAAFNPFYLTLTSSPGQSPPVSRSQTTLLSLFDAIRVGVNKYLLVKNQGNITLTVYPIFSQLANPTVVMRLIAVNPNDGWLLSYGNAATLTTDGYKIMTTDASGNTVGMYTYTAEVTQGYYLLIITYDVDAPIMRISWQSQPYACGFNSQYNDYYSIFQGCTTNTTQPGYPCVVYDPYLQLCTNCSFGYYLSEGRCFFNTTCPARQYFNYGKCYPVNPLCNLFDPFTGNCLSCLNPNHLVVNGSCVPIVLNCGPRQYQLNSQCVNVSSLCDTFNSDNGLCITCLNSTYFLLVNGNCVARTVTCLQNQYLVGLQCINIPPECFTFNTSSQTCSQCIKGYFSQKGICTKVNCPTRFVVSREGDTCVAVSELCGSYDQLGNCLSCSQPGYTVVDGVCLQVMSPLAGCAERQKLGFGQCVNASLDCKTLNLVTGNCETCSQGYYMDYTGHCSKQSLCASNQWSVNGECLQFPQNCKKVDEVGLCIQCVSSRYRLLLGQCVLMVTCGERQYLNSNKQCVDVNLQCILFNPSNGQCISCKNGNSPSSGRCCPSGMLFKGNTCVRSTQAIQNQSTSGPACLNYHPTLQYCIRCNPGYISDFSTLGRCKRQ